MKRLEKYADHAYALMRIAAGSQLWFGGIIELVGGLAVMLGLQTRAAAFLCSGKWSLGKMD